MSEIQLLMITVSLKRDAGQVSRLVQRLQKNDLFNLSVLKSYRCPTRTIGLGFEVYMW